MNKFKVGPAKTKDGRDAFIYTLNGKRQTHPVVGEVDLGGSNWCAIAWKEDGSALGFGNDVLPNNLPDPVEIEGLVVCAHSNYEIYGPECGVTGLNSTLEKLKGQRVRIRIEAVGE